MMTALALRIPRESHAVKTEREIRVEPQIQQQGEMKCREIQPIQAGPEVPCAPDDQESESSWGPVLRHNVAQMAVEDGKEGEETRSFNLMFRANFSRECGAGCVEINIEQHKAAYSDIQDVTCNQLEHNERCQI